MTPSRTKRQLIRRRELLAQAWSLVPPIAQRYALASPEPLDDLIQEGLLGLISAADRYSETLQVPFDCFARPHIRGAILHHLRDRVWSVRLPRRQAELQQRLRQAPGLEPQSLLQNSEQLQRWAAMVHASCFEALTEAQLNAEAAGVAQGQGSPVDYTPEQMHASWHNLSSAQLLALIANPQRRVVEAVVLKGWSYRRTAAELKVSPATVQRHLHRGLGQLRTLLQTTRIKTGTPRRAPSAA